MKNFKYINLLSCLLSININFTLGFGGDIFNLKCVLIEVIIPNLRLIYFCLPEIFEIIF